MKAEIEKLLLELVQSQQQSLLKYARRILPNLTPEDILQPNDYPELENHPHFRYEEGVLSGLQSSLMAIRALINDKECS